MKFICNQSELVNALNISLRAVSSKSTLPILECVLLEAVNGSIKLTSNDMELGIETKIEGRVDVPGKVCLNAKLFSDMVRKLPEDIIIVEVDSNNTAYLTSGKVKFNIPGQSGDEFPLLPSVTRQTAVTVSQFTLKELIRQTIFSISDNDTNKVMTGEYFEIKDNELKVTSLDGHRISIRNVLMKDNYSATSAIIPGKTLNEIGKILGGDSEKNVSIYFMERYVCFEFDNTVMLSRLIDGKFYNVSQMIHNNFDTKVTVNKKDFIDCLDRALLLVKESEKRPLIMDIQDGIMTMNMNSSIGNMDEELMITKDGSNLMIGFNPRFLMDALRAIDDEEITIYLTTAKMPCFIRDAEETYIYLILPVNIGNRQGA